MKEEFAKFIDSLLASLPLLDLDILNTVKISYTNSKNITWKLRKGWFFLNSRKKLEKVKKGQKEGNGERGKDTGWKEWWRGGQTPRKTHCQNQKDQTNHPTNI